MVLLAARCPAICPSWAALKTSALMITGVTSCQLSSLPLGFFQTLYRTPLLSLRLSHLLTYVLAAAGHAVVSSLVGLLPSIMASLTGPIPLSFSCHSANSLAVQRELRASRATLGGLLGPFLSVVFLPSSSSSPSVLPHCLQGCLLRPSAFPCCFPARCSICM